jgi:FtsZ-binding cell division protein ZapB
MVTIEQVELLEAKVAKAIEYVKQLSFENRALKDENNRTRAEEAALRTRVESLQKRNAELEELLGVYQKDQKKIETLIVSALERLNSFEDILSPVKDRGLMEKADEITSGLANEGREGPADVAPRSSPEIGGVVPERDENAVAPREEDVIGGEKIAVLGVTVSESEARETDDDGDNVNDDGFLDALKDGEGGASDAGPHPELDIF